MNKRIKMNTDILRDGDFEWLVKKDLEIYPTDHPVTEATIKKWYGRHPEFGMVFREDGEIKGVNIVIPLNRKGWEGLIKGDLMESDCDEKYVFNNEKDREIGLHIYHIQKTAGINTFYRMAFTGLNRVLEKLKKKNKELKVIGVSALCGTEKGIGLFFNKFNCREISLISEDHILTLDNRIEVKKILNQATLDMILQNGYEYVTRCKMLLIYPDMPSMIWSFLTDEPKKITAGSCNLPAGCDGQI